jgi:hypothetical protein
MNSLHPEGRGINPIDIKQVLYKKEEYNNSNASQSVLPRFFLIFLIISGTSISKVAFNWILVIA